MFTSRDIMTNIIYSKGLGLVSYQWLNNKPSKNSKILTFCMLGKECQDTIHLSITMVTC